MAGYKLTEAINFKAWTGKVLQAIKNVSVNVGDVTVNTSDLEALQTTTNTNAKRLPVETQPSRSLRVFVVYPKSF